ncbi:hypothetical protein GCM10010172_39400 [Paractinoplanes ferrugineus]|uniref:EAL domain-containing protein n=1 Tax=Paractinoplanes ferrugineus TaxID=113564 RepID=A0A919J0Y0_9ACTN|nr:EAL domain-containing protein [Actinoplanes ferrugineus]GIE12716.1 hypothetical protein Afe05nite_45560 [Actinoplanes ferrugineus]
MDLETRVGSVEQIIDTGAVHPVFQPIVELSTRRIVGVEALTRGPAGSPLHYPDALFAAANQAGMLHELDTMCAALAIEGFNAHRGSLPPLLFVNSEPGALTKPPTPALRAALANQRDYRIVMELTERTLAANPTGLLQVAQMCHAVGNALALDDVGADPLSLAFLPLIEPEVVKLDMHLLRDPTSADTIATVAGVGAYAQRTGAVVLAEGIETEYDLATATALGATWGQGFFFGKPGPLQNLAGRPMNAQARLRAAQPGLHHVAGTLFTTASAAHPPRQVSRHVAAAFADHLLQEATTAGQHGVVLAMNQDPESFDQSLPRLAQIAARVGFTGVVRPPGSAPAPDGVRQTIDDTLSTERFEAALVVVRPGAAAALCLRRLPDPDMVELVLSHDPTVVHGLARMLLGQLGTRFEFPAVVGGPRSA